MDKKTQRKPEVEIDVIPLFKALISNLWLMFLVGVLVGASAFCMAKILVKPTYRSSFTAYVNNQQVQTSKDYLTSSDLSAMKELVRTYSHILTSNTVLTAAAESIGMDVSYSTLKSIVSTEIKNDTEIITVNVVTHDPEKSYALADAIAKTAPSYLAEIVEGSSMKIIDYPEVPKSRYQPSYVKYAILGFIFGALAVAIIVLIRHFMDDVVRSEDEIERRFGVPILGVLPDLNAASRSEGNSGAYEYGYGSSKPDVKERSLSQHE